MNITPVETQKHTNLDVIYGYTESVLKSVSASIDDLNSKLIAIIGFSGLMLRFAGDLRPVSLPFGLPNNFLKLAICAFFAIAIASSASGLLPKVTGSVASPKTLLDKWYEESDELCKVFIMEGWKQAIEQFVQLRITKIIAASIAVTCLVFGTILYAINITLS